MSEIFSEYEQEEIINEFLKVIDINDNKKLIKSNIETCRTCKINLPNTYLFKTFPTDIAKNICQYSFSECNGCKQVKKLLTCKNENKSMLERLINAIREREDLNIQPLPFEDDSKTHKYLWTNEFSFYYSRLNTYPSYKKIINDILDDKKQKNIYTQKIHNELKQCYKNHWQMKVEIARGESLDIEFPIHRWMKENNNDDVRRILNKVMDFIKNKNGKDELVKLSNNIIPINYPKFSITNDFKTKFPEDTKIRTKKVPVQGWI